jgi:hypothetical protein
MIGSEVKSIKNVKRKNGGRNQIKPQMDTDGSGDFDATTFRVEFLFIR